MAVARILDVGNCDFDHGSIRALIESNFDARVDRARLIAEALDALKRSRYDLVLVNRRIEADGGEGFPLVRTIMAGDDDARPAVMLISNYGSAQAEAVAAGAALGFGKSDLQEPETIERLGEFLPRKA